MNQSPNEVRKAPRWSLRGFLLITLGIASMTASCRKELASVLDAIVTPADTGDAKRWGTDDLKWERDTQMSQSIAIRYTNRTSGAESTLLQGDASLMDADIPVPDFMRSLPIGTRVDLHVLEQKIVVEVSHPEDRASERLTEPALRSLLNMHHLEALDLDDAKWSATNGGWSITLNRS